MDENSKQPTVFDTDQQILGKVYAKALLGFGEQSGKTEQLVEELKAVVEVIDELPKLKSALVSPRISGEAKSSLLRKAFADRVSGELLNFLSVVGKRGRFDCLGAVASSAVQMRDQQLGRVEATLTTAEEVDDAVRQKITDRLVNLLGSQVNLSSEVDPNIIGGMIVRVGDTVYDGSVSNQLEQLRTKATQKAADAIREQLDRFTSA